MAVQHFVRCLASAPCLSSRWRQSAGIAAVLLSFRDRCSPDGASTPLRTGTSSADGCQPCACSVCRGPDPGSEGSCARADGVAQWEFWFTLSLENAAPSRGCAEKHRKNKVTMRRARSLRLFVVLLEFYGLA
ncbi:hypothetical protein FQA47_017573 [Oryzias melastigma]|uniref:Uncharacterized protein n=1 Tax=Oryzias melastigma TaxID=30732 RepID=A0A834CWL3_ORYME|nr:hypothetical protein FQA47_017573 [Oryzias melastigma]